MVSEEKIFENGGRTTDRRTDERTMDGRRLDGYTISSPCEPYGSGELKTMVRSSFAYRKCILGNDLPTSIKTRAAA